MGAGAAITLVAPKLSMAAGLSELNLVNLYDPDDITRLRFSEATLSLVGKVVAARGYIIPHTRERARFFIVSDQPLEKCPHCDTTKAMPREAIAYYPRPDTITSPLKVEFVRIHGTLELGAKRDFDTGFVTTVRLRQLLAAPI